MRNPESLSRQRTALVEPIIVAAALIIVLSSNSGLSDTPIIDVVPEHDELAMAGHRRGFWPLDKIVSLRQFDATATDGNLVLFTAASAVDPMILLGAWPRGEPIEELMAELEWEDGGAVDGCGRSIVSESGSTQR